MKILNNFKTSDLLFLDIETARVVDKLDPESQLYDAWSYKHRHANEYKDKSGIELTPQQYFEEKGALYAPFSRIVCIVVARIVEGPNGEALKFKSFSGDEKVLLENFNKDLGQFTVSRPGAAFVTFNGNGFDIPLITKRMIVNGITLPPMLDLAGEKPWTINTIDLSSLWRGNSFYPDSLLAVATALGLPSPKNNMDGSEVSNAFYAGRIDEIVQYCKQDVHVTANIYRKFSQKPLLSEYKEQPLGTI